jgi:hypothetical protein
VYGDDPDRESMLPSPAAMPDQHASDEEYLASLGYAQQLFREMGGFSNFAISFSIISILTPAVPFCHLGFSVVRPVERRYERAKVAAGTRGAAFRERRWSSRLEQSEVAKEIGVSVAFPSPPVVSVKFSR